MQGAADLTCWPTTAWEDKRGRESLLHRLASAAVRAEADPNESNRPRSDADLFPKRSGDADLFPGPQSGWPLRRLEKQEQPTLFLEADKGSAGSPRGITPPGLPQIRTCGTTASGSSHCGLTCALLPGRIPGTRYWGSVSPTCRPRPVPQRGVPFPSPGSRGTSSPAAEGTMRHSDTWSSISAGSLRSPADTAGASCPSLPPAEDARAGGPGAWEAVSPGPQQWIRRRGQVSQVPGEPS